MTIRVLHNSWTMNLGGAESRIMDIYRAIDRDHFKFDFVVYEEQEQYFEQEILELGGQIHRVPAPGVSFVAHVISLARLLTKHSYDVVHSHSAHHSGIVSAIAWTKRVPIRIAHARTSSSMPSKRIIKKAYQLIGTGLIRWFATHRLAISKPAAEYIFGVSAPHQVMPNAIDLGKYLGGGSDISLRQEYDIPRGAVLVGQIGRLVPVKNQQFTIHLLEKLLTRSPDTYLVLLGDGNERSTLHKLASSKGLNNRIIFAGAVSNVAEWLATIDVVLMPSLYEGLGSAILEAQAAGVPTVASNNVPEEVDLGLSLVEFLSLDEDLEAWADAVQSSLGLTRPSSDNIVRVFTEENYTLNAVIDDLTKLYKGLK